MSGESSHSHELTGAAPQGRGRWRPQKDIQPWELPGQRLGTGQRVQCSRIWESLDVAIDGHLGLAVEQKENPGS